MTRIFQFPGVLFEKLVAIVVIVSDAGTEDIDEGKASVPNPAFDEFD